MGVRFNEKRKDNYPGPGSYKVYSEFGDLPKIKRRKFKFRKRNDEDFYMEKEEQDEVKPEDEAEKMGKKKKETR